MDIVQVLIEAKADLNIQDGFGDTALMKAVEYGETEIVQIPIEQGVDLSIPNNDKKNCCGYIGKFFGRKVFKKRDHRGKIERGIGLSNT